MPSQLTTPRRVLITADAVGGLWTWAVDAAHGLAARGISTVLAVPGPSPTPAQQQQARRVPGLVLTMLPSCALDWTATSHDQVRATGEALAELARRQGVDLVQVNGAGLAAFGEYGVPLVVATHSCVATWWRAVRGDLPLPDDFRWRTDLVRAGLDRADVVLAPSAAFAHATARAYGLGRVPVVVRNGRAPNVRLGGESSPRDYVFTAGRLWDEGKGIATLDQATLLLGHPIVAAGPLDGPAGQRATFRWLRTPGALGEAEIGQMLGERPVFASPALYEPFGLAVLEAAQAGCALVLSDIPTFRELWEGAAVFVPTRDASALADALRGVLTDRGRRTFLGAAARERARRYTLDAMTDALLRAWDPLLQGRGLGPDRQGGESAA